MAGKQKTGTVKLNAEEKMLVTLRDELYGGSWDRMLKDLKDRLKGRPYIFKLVNRIKDDLKRIEKLKANEKRLGGRSGVNN